MLFPVDVWKAREFQVHIYIILWESSGNIIGESGVPDCRFRTDYMTKNAEFGALFPLKKGKMNEFSGIPRLGKAFFQP